MSSAPSPLAALGEALHERAGDVAERVLERAGGMLARYEDEVAERISRDVIRNCTTGTQLVASVLITGQPPAPDSWSRVTATGKAPAEDLITLADMMKLYLYWRDAALAVVREEAERLGISRAVVRDANAVVRAGSDASLVRTARTFDTKRRELQAALDEERARLAHLARHDPLTGLPNRLALLERLRDLVADSDKATACVVFVDLDHFKAVNDRYGHAAGDELLVSVARRLAGIVRPTDTVARLAGDEFIVVCEGTSAVDDPGCDSLADRIAAVFERPFRIAGESYSGTASIGVAGVREGDDADALLARADAAMYEAKRARESVIRAMGPG